MQKGGAVGRYTASRKIKELKNANMQNGGAVGRYTASRKIKKCKYAKRWCRRHYIG